MRASEHSCYSGFFGCTALLFVIFCGPTIVCGSLFIPAYIPFSGTVLVLAKGTVL